MHLTAIGTTGEYAVYVDYTVEEAQQRYFEEELTEIIKQDYDCAEDYFDSEGDYLQVKTVEVKNDKFHAYSVWG